MSWWKVIRQWTPIIGITFVAISMIGFLASHSPNFNIDQFTRLAPIFDMVAGEGYTTPEKWSLTQPGVGFITYFFTLLTGDVEYGAMAGPIFSYILLVPLIFYCGKYLFDYKTGIMAAIFLAFCPQQIWFSHQALTSPVFEFMLCLGFLSHTKIILDGPTWRRCIAHGIITGLMWLIRSEGFLPMLLSYAHMTVVLIMHQYKKKLWGKFHFQTSAKMLIVSILFYLITAAPWIVMIQHHTGEWRFIGRSGAALLTTTTIKKGNIINVTQPQVTTSGSVATNSNQYSSVPMYIINNIGDVLLRIKINLPHATAILIKAFKHIFIPVLFLILLSFLFQAKALLPFSALSLRKINIFTSLLILRVLKLALSHRKHTHPIAHMGRFF
jgi:4-amino-4-deoxy-L-arabinose transferase-like glycosyltransferase